MAYLLDSNVFIDAKNHYYGFDVCPGFWCWIDHSFKEGKTLSIKNVRDELMPRGDKLSLWCKPRKQLFVEPADEQTVESMKLLATWVVGNYEDAAQSKFLGAADFRLVAYAHAHNHTVVTTEVFSSGFEVKIPNACKILDVNCIHTFEMLRREKVKFHFNT